MRNLLADFRRVAIIGQISRRLWEDLRMKMMSMGGLTLVLLLTGCGRMFTNTALVADIEPGPDGQLAAADYIFIRQTLGGEVSIRQQNEFYPNGRLKRCVFEPTRLTSVALAFYPDGQLKSETRYKRDEVRFAQHYDEQGKVTETVGERLTEYEREMLRERAAQQEDATVATVQ
jgi:hypothetical protein